MKRITFFSLLLISLSFLSSCYSSHMAATYTGDFSNENRKIIYDCFLTYKTTNSGILNDSIIKVIENKKGLIIEQGTYRTIVRVKNNLLKEIVIELEKLGKISSKKFKGQDVTDEYLDYEIRLDNAEKARKRYLELLSQAENVEAALKVEKELERLNEKIDVLKGKMNRIDHLSEYSTITITYSEHKKPGIIGYVFVGLYKGVKWLFVRN